jgi:hypothetical protein
MKKNNALEIVAPLEVSQAFVKRRRMARNRQTLSLCKHILQYQHASWHTPGVATIPNIVPKGIHILNSRFSKFIFLFVLRFPFETHHFLTKRTFCISVENVPQMTRFVQMQSQTGRSFSQLKRQRMKFV